MHNTIGVKQAIGVKQGWSIKNYRYVSNVSLGRASFHMRGFGTCYINDGLTKETRVSLGSWGSVDCPLLHLW
jgi:hypothetical protein